jgi:hypothetical protein
LICRYVVDKRNGAVCGAKEKQDFRAAKFNTHPRGSDRQVRTYFLRPLSVANKSEMRAPFLTAESAEDAEARGLFDVTITTGLRDWTTRLIPSLSQVSSVFLHGGLLILSASSAVRS